jgi:hypothetical protein
MGVSWRGARKKKKSFIKKVEPNAQKKKKKKKTRNRGCRTRKPIAFFIVSYIQ